MGVPSSRSSLAGSFFALITASAIACQPAPQSLSNALSSGASNRDPNSLARFVFDGQRVALTRLHNTSAELLYENRNEDFTLPNPGADELYIIFRDGGRRVDTVYRLNGGSGELVYFFNDDRRARKIVTDHQLIVDVSGGGSWSMDIYKRDPADEMLDAFNRRDATTMSKLLSSHPTLSDAPYSGGMTLLMITGDNDLHIAQMAVDTGANVNARDQYGNTPLHYAAYYNRKKVAELLVTHKAQIDAKNFDGDTPLHFAVRLRDKALANYLIESGADGNVRNGEGKTPLAIALDN